MLVENETVKKAAADTLHVVVAVLLLLVQKETVKKDDLNFNLNFD